MRASLVTFSPHSEYVFSAMVGTARCAVPARVVVGGTNDRVAPAIRKSCAAARGADIAARCPYHAKHIPGWKPVSPFRIRGATKTTPARVSRRPVSRLTLTGAGPGQRLARCPDCEG